MFANVLLQSFERRFPECGSSNMLYALAHYLDPSRKGIICEMVYNNLTEVKGEISSRWSPEEDNNNQVEQASNANQNDGENEDPLEQLFRLKSQQLQQSEPANASAIENPYKEEMIRYDAKPKAKTTVDILKWWLNEKDDLPLLFKIAQEVLGIPVSSCKSERVFSKSGMVSLAKIIHKISNKCNIAFDSTLAISYYKSNLFKPYCTFRIK